MVAAPKHASFNIVSRLRPASYPLDVYCSDVANALINFDSGNGASSTSNTFWTCPESAMLTDVAFETGLTDTARLQLLVNNNNKGFLPYAVHDDGNPSRPKLMISLNRGDVITGIQRA